MKAQGQVDPLGLERHKANFTADKTWVDIFRKATALLSHRLLSGDMSQVLDPALSALCQKLMKERFGVPAEPSRAPAVWRDEPVPAPQEEPGYR